MPCARTAGGGAEVVKSPTWPVSALCRPPRWRFFQLLQLFLQQGFTTALGEPAGTGMVEFSHLGSDWLVGGTPSSAQHAGIPLAGLWVPVGCWGSSPCTRAKCKASAPLWELLRSSCPHVYCVSTCGCFLPVCSCFVSPCTSFHTGNRHFFSLCGLGAENPTSCQAGQSLSTHTQMGL